MSQKTNTQMAAVITAGGSVLYKGILYNSDNVGSLPSDSQIAADNAAAAQQAKTVTTDGVTTVQAQLDSADASTAADVTAAPTSGQKIVVDSYTISVGATALAVQIGYDVSGTFTAIAAKHFLPVNGTVTIRPQGGLKVPVADKKLQVKASASGNIGITVTYHSAP